MALLALSCSPHHFAIERVHYCPMQCSTVVYSETPPSLAECSSAQNSTVYCSTVQYSAMLHAPERNSRTR